MILNKNPLELLVIVGMPGSGKTTHVNKLLADNAIDGFCDDYEYGPINGLNPRHRPQDQELLDALSTGKRWAIADTRYCDPRERDKLEYALRQVFPNLKLRFEYFENNPNICQHNAAIRKGSLPRHEINLMYYYTGLYDIPKNAKVLKIFRAI